MLLDGLVGGGGVVIPREGESERQRPVGDEAGRRRAGVREPTAAREVRRGAARPDSAFIVFFFIHADSFIKLVRVALLRTEGHSWLVNVLAPSQLC